MFERINIKEDKNYMIELLDGYECVFKKDPDSLVPKIESSIEDLSIRIKPGFGYSTEEEKRELFSGLIVEFEQLIEDRENQEEKELISIKGKILDVINFLEGIMVEMEKLSNKEKIKLEKNPIGSIEGVVSVGRGRKTTLRIPVLARTEKGDISAMSYKDIKEVADCVKEFDY